MGSNIKNGKERTNHICTLKMLSVLFLLFCLSGWQAVLASEKTWVIVIDAGHGGKDPGALGAISREKNINLAIAIKAGAYLEQNMGNVKVLYTRDSDVFVGLKERAEFANKNKADLFISIHANANPSKTIRGTETYIMGRAKDSQNLEVAMKENEVIMLEEDFSAKYEGFDPKSPESYIMFTVMQNIFQEQSTNLAANIQGQFKNRAGRIDRGVRQAEFWVLYMTTMPSVLVETGYISNVEEEKYLVSNQGQEYIASAIYRASRDYINEIDKKSNISTLITAGSSSVASTPDTESLASFGGLKFMIQIASSTSKKELIPENFNGIKDITELASQDRFRYATGSFMNYSEAVEYRKKIEPIYPDAFVIAVQDNKILPLQDAFNLQQNKTK